MRSLIALLLFAGCCFSAVTKLYMKDGNYHLVREWKREGDRVKFYSTERSDWEEVPVELVDLRRSEAEIAGRKEALTEETKSVVEEEKAVRSQRDEILKIPQDPGVYTLDEKGELRIFPVAESKVHTSKGRSVLRAVARIPLINGKATVELDGEYSSNIVAEDRQEFYLQLAKDERFGIIRLTSRKGVRIAERLTIVPVANETVEEIDEVETFRKQLSEGGLYKIWPAKPLEPGEYAVIEYTQGKVEPQIWDFQFRK